MSRTSFHRTGRPSLQNPSSRRLHWISTPYAGAPNGLFLQESGVTDRHPA